MNRRSFVQALVGLPIAAVVLPRVSLPEAAAAPAPRTVASGSAFEFIGYHHVDETTRAGRPLTVTLKADTTQFTAAIDETHRHLDRRLHDRLMQELR